MHDFIHELLTEMGAALNQHALRQNVLERQNN